jgi:hypothetical protein
LRFQKLKLSPVLLTIRPCGEFPFMGPHRVAARQRPDYAAAIPEAREARQALLAPASAVAGEQRFPSEARRSEQYPTMCVSQKVAPAAAMKAARATAMGSEAERSTH